jgi:peptidoglycan/LPS O-acetylase OafA/YrhL
MKYRSDIDGLRAVAVLSVMLYHLSGAWLPGGFTGVDVFFVISGYVVCGSLASSDSARLRGFIAGFYARRLARIVPALVVMLVTAAVLATLFIPRAWLNNSSDRTALYAFFGLSNWVMLEDDDAYFAPRAEFNPYAHTWSLGVEEQFYLIFPLLCFLWIRARSCGRLRQARGTAAALFGLGIASLIGCYWATSQQPLAAFYTLWFRFWELASGALLYQWTAPAESDQPQRPAFHAVAPWLGAAAVGAGFAFADADAFPVPWAIPSVIGTVLLIGRGGASPSHPIRRALAHPCAVWIGKRSYSLYLWHWPVYVLLRWTVGLELPAIKLFAVAATFTFATASYAWIEIPFRHSRALSSVSPALRVAFFISLVIAGWKVADGVLWRNQTIGLSVVSRHTSDWYSEATMSSAVRPRSCSVALTRERRGMGVRLNYLATGCDQLSGSRPRHVTVFGDSHATSYLPLFDQLSGEFGISVIVFAQASCRYLDLLAPMDGHKDDECLNFWRAASLETLRTARAGDILFLPGLRQHRFGEQWSELREPDRVADATLNRPAQDLIAEATREAAGWLSPFTARGVTVLFEAPKPLFRSPAFRCSDWFNAANPVCRGGLTQPRAFLEALRYPIVKAMRELAAGNSAVHVWDPFPTLCPSDPCSAFRGDRPLFFDGDHISDYGNTVLYPAFAAAISAAVPTSPPAERAIR